MPHGQKCLVNQCPSCVCLGWPGVTVLLHGLEIKSMCFVCLCDSVTFSCCGGDGKIRQRLGRTARLLVSSSCTAAAHLIGATWAEVSSQPVPQLRLPWLAWCYGASTWARNQIYGLSRRRFDAVVEMAKFGRGWAALHACWSAALAQLLPISSVPHGQKCLVNQCPSCVCLGWPGVTVLLHGLEIKSMCCLYL